MKKDKIINKIKNLLELSSSDSEAEAALALSKAKELMLKYGINDSDLIISNIKESRAFACRGKKPPEYLSILAEGICKLFECQFYNSYGWRPDVGKWGGYVDEFIFVGFSPNQETCKYCFDVLSRQLKTARKNYMKSLPNWGDRPRRADAYALGWSISVFEKVEMLVPKQELALSDEKGLIPVNMIKQFVENKISGSIKPKSNSRSTVDLLAGSEDGNKVEIRKGMDFREKQMLA